MEWQVPLPAGTAPSGTAGRLRTTVLYSAPVPAPTDPLAAFSDPTRDWFSSSFAEPTPAQAQGWPAIAAGEHTLICAPTGSRQDARRVPVVHRPADGRAAARPIRCGACACSTSRRSRRSSMTSNRNLRAPLAGIALAARKLGAARARGIASGCAPATRRPRSGAPSASTRRTSSSRRPSRSTCCSPRRRARRCAASSGSSSTRSTRLPAPSAAPTWRCRWSGSSR